MTKSNEPQLPKRIISISNVNRFYLNFPLPHLNKTSTFNEFEYRSTSKSEEKNIFEKYSGLYIFSIKK